MTGQFWGLVALYLAAINAVTFWVFAFDKRQAVRDRARVPERALLQLAAAGGSAGAVVAQQLLRHKTRKQPFANLLLAICAVQAGFLVWAIVGR